MAAFLDAFWKVHPKDTHSCLSDGADPGDAGTVDSEMLSPGMAARMKQFDHGAAFVHRGDVAALVPVAGRAGKREMSASVRPSCFSLMT